MPVSKDAYVSYRGSRRRDFGDVDRPAPLVFVDLAEGDVDALRTLPRRLTRQWDGLVLVRGPQPLDGDAVLKAVRQRHEAWGLNPQIAVLDHPAGRPARVRGLDGEEFPVDDHEWLRRARAVELEALLEHGQAIWRPTSFHYRLMTGEHVGSYVKVADAIREPRDASILAAWLMNHAVPDLGLILDSGTMTPIAQAFHLHLAKAGITPGPVKVLDQTARVATDVDALVDRAAGPAGLVLAVVSVSSSGSVINRLLGAFERRGRSLAAANVAVMVDKGNENPDRGRIDVWTPLDGEQPLVARNDPDELGCRLCRTPGLAPVVPVNPLTFDALLPSQLRTIVPDLDDPRENRPLWEAAFRTRAIAVERAAVMAMRSHRSSDRLPMGIKLRLDRLITDDEFVEAVRGRIEHAQDEEHMPSDADLVLVADHEVQASFADFWPRISDMLVGSHPPEFHTFPADGDFSEELRGRIRSAERILVLALGTVTGASLQRALVGVQDARKRTATFSLHSFVVHARPATALEWRTMRNSFGRSNDRPHLHYGWKSILPDRSPLKEEGRHLTLLDNAAGSGLSDAARAFVETRLELCGRSLTGGADLPNDDTEDESILWGTLPQDDVLTPDSIYGQGLDAITTYVAVGSAMAAQLAQDKTGVPELRVFEIASMTRSYYDPIILCCFMRWLRPHEAFWGWTGVEAETTAMHIVRRAEGRHRQLIVPEMLLAAGQGKLTAEAARVIRDAAAQMLEDEQFAPVHAALTAGLALVDRGEAPPPTEGLFRPPLDDSTSGGVAA